MSKLKEFGKMSVNCSLAKTAENTFTLPEDLINILRAKKICLLHGAVSTKLELGLPATLLRNWHHFGTQTPSRRRRTVYICGEHDLQNQLWVSQRTRTRVLKPLRISESLLKGEAL